MSAPFVGENFRDVWVAPNDLSYVWGCRRCWWLLRSPAQIRRPFGDFPAVFQTMDGLQKMSLTAPGSAEDAASRQAMRLDFLGIPGRIIDMSRRFKSKPIIRDIGDVRVKMVVGGEYDTLAELDDGTLMILDEKSSSQNERNRDKFTLSLNSYAHVLENLDSSSVGGVDAAAVAAKIKKSQISRLGILIWTPQQMVTSAGRVKILAEDGEILAEWPTAPVGIMAGQWTLQEIPRNRNLIEEILEEMALCMASPSAPPFDKDCPYCKHTADAVRWASQTGKAAADRLRVAAGILGADTPAPVRQEGDSDQRAFESQGAAQ